MSHQRQHNHIDLAHNDPVAPFMKHSVRIGSISGIDILVHYTFPAICVLLTILAVPAGAFIVLLTAILFGPVLFVTILLHELGHCWAAIRTGSTVHSILFWPLGGLAFIGHSNTPKDDLKVSAAGPATHIPQTLLWGALLIGFYQTSFDAAFLKALCFGAIQINVSLFLFNLFIPAYPLDGGRILVNLLLMKECTVETTAKACIGVSSFMALLLLACGGYMMFAAKNGINLILVAFWILYQAHQLYTHVKSNTIHVHPLFNFPQDTSNQQLNTLRTSSI
ncbi:hypothetical protein CYMTET_44122 [Cymbomonas tetramitiformis]|uniref:Peptidase M50 domain-containing protein n=1 Tax=Cymbomonas tetramitiformis TaxID=36881 RepID=A0AAE0EZM5_9CHLO|nr:hypothetical protein CYMTET_44122 [Cymbomonas tetramitiformis]